MAETDNMNLALPGSNEYVDVEVLNENFRKIDAAVLLALAAAAPYSAKTYALGAYCTRGGRLYRCTTAITAAETWTAGHWTETTVTAELIAHATNKSNPHGVTAAQTGAYTKGETDTLLAKKVPFGYGWGEANAVNAPYNDPDYITKTCIFVAASGNIPADGIWIGFAYFSDNSANGNMLLTALTGPVGSMYTRYKTSGNEWSAWKQITTETELDTKVSKSGDTMTGGLKTAYEVSSYNASATPGTDHNLILRTHGGVNIADLLHDTGDNCFSGIRFLDPKNSLTNIISLVRSINGGWEEYQILHAQNAQPLGFPKIAIGSYVGTGTYSSANPNSLTFDFEPKVVIVVADGSNGFCAGFLIVRGQTYSNGIGSFSAGSVGLDLHITWSGNTVSWYTTNDFDAGKANAQMNTSGMTFRYVALG